VNQADGRPAQADRTSQAEPMTGQLSAAMGRLQGEHVALAKQGETSATAAARQATSCWGYIWG